MRNARPSSPTSSVTSADEALYELLGIDKPVGFVEEEGDEETDNPSPRCSELQHLIPPPYCMRPQTPHTAILLHAPYRLQPAQSNYVISVGYQATNNGGTTFGPTYITEAIQHGDESAARVKLQDPNHHKVCVFTNPLISKWIDDIIVAAGTDIRIALDAWCNDNHFSPLIKLNPRLRLLRYDARDEDIFEPHYDATTFLGSAYESKLTVLLYLNTGGASDFQGGKTLFLNAVNPSQHPLAVEPTTGSFVIFNHELHHASQALQILSNKVVHNIPGGTKFVLRTDVMLPVATLAAEQEESAGLSDAPIIPTVHDIKDRYLANVDTSALLRVLQDLEISSSKSLPPQLDTLLVELGVDSEVARRFVDACKKKDSST